MAPHPRGIFPVAHSTVAFVLLHTVAAASDRPGKIWISRPGFNCYPDSGATIVNGTEQIESQPRTFESCKATCEAIEGCTAVVVLKGNVTGMCGLRSDIKLSKCEGDSGYDVWERVLEHLPLPRGVWESFGNGTVCRVSANDDSEDSSGSVMIYGTDTMLQCKGICGTTDICYGIEYMAESQRCEVWTQPIDYVKPRPGYECWAFEPEDIFPILEDSMTMKASVLPKILGGTTVGATRAARVLIASSLAAVALMLMATVAGIHRLQTRKQPADSVDEEAASGLLSAPAEFVA